MKKNRQRMAVGHLDVRPPLNPAEVEFLRTLARDDQPCPWVPSRDGRRITLPDRLDREECTGWLRFVIRQFLCPGAAMSRRRATAYQRFTFDHSISGRVVALDPERTLMWSVQVNDNRVASKVDWPPEARPQKDRVMARRDASEEGGADVIDLATRRARA
jgi:hypothetical protein